VKKLANFVVALFVSLLSLGHFASARDDFDKAFKDVPLEKKRGQIVYTFNDLYDVRYFPSLVRSVNRINAHKMHSKGFKGKGYSVAVLDTGVLVSHPFLKDRVVAEACFTYEFSCPNGQNKMVGPGSAKPVHWHGTHVAGIVAGSSPEYSGVAPDSSIVAVNIFEKTGSSYEINLVRGLEYVLSLRSVHNIVAVNLSLGTSKMWTEECDFVSPNVTKAVKNLMDSGVAVVAASGNGFSHGMSNPACISGVIGVAATYADNDNVTDFSNISRFTSFAAPGDNIISSGRSESSYIFASGTSMASPHVAGAVALHRSAFPSSDVPQFLSMLRSDCPMAYDKPTEISVCRLDFSVAATGKPVPVVTTTTTVPVVVTTTTVPVQGTTTTVVYKTEVGKPRLTRLSRSKDRVLTVVYVDVIYGKRSLSRYELVCSDGLVYPVSLGYGVGVQTQRIDNFPVTTKSCHLKGVDSSGRDTPATTNIPVVSG
jgi:subtilisin family serine protease